jgi:hypothetical protein
MPLIVTLVGFCAKTVTQKNIKNRKMETLRMVIEFGKNEVNKWLKHGINPMDTVLRMWLIWGNDSKKMYFVEK